MSPDNTFIQERKPLSAMNGFVADTDKPDQVWLNGLFNGDGAAFQRRLYELTCLYSTPSEEAAERAPKTA